jgi:hypothetical protein
LIASQSVPALADSAAYKPSDDFEVFWSQVRTALLQPDPRTIAAASSILVPETGEVLGSYSISFKWDSVNIDRDCGRQAVSAYLTNLLNTNVSNRSGDTTMNWRGFLEQNPSLDYRMSPGVDRGQASSYIVMGIMRFAYNETFGHWQIYEMRDDMEKIFAGSDKGGGPS